MPIDISSNILSSGSIGPNGTVYRPVLLDGSTSALAAPDPSYLYKNGVTTNGMYWLNPGRLGANRFYIDFTYNPGKPMTLVLSNRSYTNGLSGLTYSSATSATINYTGTYDSNRNCNLFVRLPYWRYLGDTIIQGCKGLNATYSSGTHNVSMGSMDVAGKWKFAGFSSTYAFRYPRDYTQLLGSGSSGWYSYHAVNGFSLTTYDLDQDANGGNCSTYYNNNPWWYGSCWSGNYFAGGGYVDAPYWDGSGGLWYAYGAAYIAWDSATMDN